MMNEIQRSTASSTTSYDGSPQGSAEASDGATIFPAQLAALQQRIVEWMQQVDTQQPDGVAGVSDANGAPAIEGVVIDFSAEGLGDALRLLGTKNQEARLRTAKEGLESSKLKLSEAHKANIQKIEEYARKYAESNEANKASSIFGWIAKAFAFLAALVAVAVAAAIVQGVMGIASGAMQVGAGVAQIGKAVEAFKASEDATAFSKQSQELASTDPTQAAEFSQKASSSSAAATKYASEAQAYGQIGGGFSAIANAVGGIVAGTLTHEADLKEVERNRYETDAKTSEAAVQRADEMMRSTQDVIQDMKTKSESAEQARSEGTRGIARNI